jgi:hypothetical protein
MRNHDASTFPIHFDPEVDKVARHEIGHWVAARRLGFGAGDVTAKIMAYPKFGRQGTSEIMLRCELLSIDDVIDYLERRIQICWAGAIAEALDVSNGRIRDVAESCPVEVEVASHLIEGASGRTDANLADELLQLLSNLTRTPQTVDPVERLHLLSEILWRRTVELIEAESQLILTLAFEFARRIRSVGVNTVATFSVAQIEAMPDVQQWVIRHGLKAAV